MNSLLLTGAVAAVLLALTSTVTSSVIPQKRYDPPLTNESFLRLQRNLVLSHGSLDILGTLIQRPDGSIYSGDFGQNIHNKREGQITPGEKRRAIEKMQRRLKRFLIKQLNALIKKKLSHPTFLPI